MTIWLSSSNSASLSVSVNVPGKTIWTAFIRNNNEEFQALALTILLRTSNLHFLNAQFQALLIKYFMRETAFFKYGNYLGLIFFNTWFKDFFFKILRSEEGKK